MKPDSPFPGILSRVGLTLIILIIAWAASGCAEYPVAIAVRGEYGSVSYSDKGIQITIEK